MSALLCRFRKRRVRVGASRLCWTESSTCTRRALEGTELDPGVTQKKMEKLCAKVEALLPSDTLADAEADANLSPAEILARRWRDVLAAQAAWRHCRRRGEVAHGGGRGQAGAGGVAPPLAGPRRGRPAAGRAVRARLRAHPRSSLTFASHAAASRTKQITGPGIPDLATTNPVE